jgi:hypothetical protein
MDSLARLLACGVRKISHSMTGYGKVMMMSTLVSVPEKS